MASRNVTRLAVLYFLASVALLVWPLYPWIGNRVEPRVSGLPFSLIYVLAIVAANFGVLIFLYSRRLVDQAEVEDHDG